MKLIQKLMTYCKESKKEQEKINRESRNWEARVKEPSFHNNSKNHNLYYGPFNDLSNTMKKALISIYCEESKKISTATQKALVKRKLISDISELTETGRYLAIAALGLKQQCSALGINYIRNVLESQTNIEETVLSYYQEQEWDGFFSEGRVLFELLQGFVFDPVSQFAKEVFEKKGKQEYEILGSTIFTYYETEIRNTIISNIHNYNSKALSDNLHKLRKLKNKVSFDLGYGIISFGSESPHKSIFPIDKMISLFNNIERSSLEKIALLCLDGFVSATGWPDLIIFKNGSFKLIEVKKSDKLILSQIFTLETLVKKGVEITIFKAK